MFPRELDEMDLHHGSAPYLEAPMYCGDQEVSTGSPITAALCCSHASPWPGTMGLTWRWGWGWVHIQVQLLSMSWSYRSSEHPSRYPRWRTRGWLSRQLLEQDEIAVYQDMRVVGSASPHWGVTTSQYVTHCCRWLPPAASVDVKAGKHLSPLRDVKSGRQYITPVTRLIRWSGFSPPLRLQESVCFSQIGPIWWRGMWWWVMWWWVIAHLVLTYRMWPLIPISTPYVIPCDIVMHGWHCPHNWALSVLVAAYAD